MGELETKLEASRVGKLPSVYLLPDFIDEAAEARLLSQIHSRGRWKQLSGRRLQEYGGTVHQKHGLLQASLPSWMSALTERSSNQFTTLRGPCEWLAPVAQLPGIVH